MVIVFFSLFSFYSLLTAVPLVEFLFLLERTGRRVASPSLHGMTRRLCSRLLDFSPLFLLPILVPPFHTASERQKRLRTAGSDVSPCARP